MDKIVSGLYSLNKISSAGMQFNIPRYQRLYVWVDEQVETLFNDIYTAASVEKDMYYIGGIILVKNKGNKNLFDLVDGQQRFTTLWLLMHELGNQLAEFSNILDQLSLRFAIRPKVEKYFEQLMEQDGIVAENSKEFEDLVRIDLARRRLKELILSKLTSDTLKEKFASFLANKLNFVITLVPQKTDLNKLFETLNNRGEQLSQDQILKARILSGIQNRNLRVKYSGIWNACSDTRNYFERALSFEAGSARDIANCHNRWAFDFGKIIGQFQNYENHHVVDGMNLKNILSRRKTREVDTGNEMDDIQVELHPHTSDDELQKVRSLLTFPQLLLHTLRIFRHRKGISDIHRINEKELLKTFDQYFMPRTTPVNYEEIKEFEIDCKDFVTLLFKVREAFDKYIVKWVETGQDNEDLMLKKIHKQNQKHGGHSYYLRREISDQYSGIAQLQSILYHSQQNTTQYWMTPFLNHLLSHPDFESAYGFLKKLDNVLFCTNRNEELLTERTWECMDELPEYDYDFDILKGDLGTGFPHYWFYKIEFILWHQLDSLKMPQWGNYKITAKNSIEHIGPQNPRDKRDKVCINYLDKIGNLVLVTRSINSEYADLPFTVKKAKFQEKRNGGFYDSLKSDLIYRNNTWNDDLAEKHQNKILEIVAQYFSLNQ